MLKTIDSTQSSAFTTLCYTALHYVMLGYLTLHVPDVVPSGTLPLMYVHCYANIHTIYTHLYCGSLHIYIIIYIYIHT